MIPIFFSMALAQTAAQDLMPQKSAPGSLYSPQSQSIFADRTARAKGDVLTVIIDETSVANYAAKTTGSKGDSSQANFKLFAGFLDDLFKPILNGINAASTVNGEGATQHSGRMAFRMSVVVKAVMPNGNLVIEGSRTLVTNRETQSFLLSGMVRPIDVSADNSIRSAQIAEAEIKMTGKGMIADRQRKGILTQLVDWIF